MEEKNESLIMKFYNKKLILFICIICVFFGFANNAKADYQTFGIFISTNLLASSGSEIINSFSYNITIPSGTTAVVQFSLDNATWYNSSGTLDGTNTLSVGTNTIDLSARAWNGLYFYYKMIFTSDGTNTPSLDSISLSYVDHNGSYNVYSTTGSFTSTNLLLGKTSQTIDNFVYNLISLPPNTTVIIQFSQDNSTWYNSSGTLDASNTLSVGTNTIDLSGLSWSGSSFYYKINLTSDSVYTPLLDSIILNYTYIPSLENISTTLDPIKAQDLITITPTGQGDISSNDLYFYCNETGSPTSVNTLCSQANNSYTNPYSAMTCTYNVLSGDETRTIYCRTYNGQSYSAEKTSTYVVDSTAPIISRFYYSLGSLSDTQLATITWDTNEASSTQLEYGTTNSYGTTTTEQDTDTRVTSHTATITIPACAIYHIRAISKDKAGNSVISDNMAIRTHCATPGNALADYVVGSIVNQAIQEPTPPPQEQPQVEPESQPQPQPQQSQAPQLTRQQPIIEIKAKIAELIAQLIVLLQEKIRNK